MSTFTSPLVVFDLETTGVDVRTARIVTAYVGVLAAGGTAGKGRSWLADPGVEIPAGAAAVHGISTERARAEGRPAAEVVAEIIAELRAATGEGALPLVVYNAPYDLTLLQHEAERHGLDPLPPLSLVIDPLVIDKGVDRYRKGKRTLEAACAHYGVAIEGAHDAGVDAVAAGLVAQAILTRHEDALPATLAELHAAQVAWHEEQAASFEDYMRTRNDPNFTAARGWPIRTA